MITLKQVLASDLPNYGKQCIDESEKFSAWFSNNALTVVSMTAGQKQAGLISSTKQCQQV